jgi:hypothetical protein
MGIVGPDGRPAEREATEYKIGDFGFKTNALPNEMLGQALNVARAMMAQRDPIGARTLTNPFQVEPAAQAVFMFLVQELARLEGRIEELEATSLRAGSWHGEDP